LIGLVEGVAVARRKTPSSRVADDVTRTTSSGETFGKNEKHQIESVIRHAKVVSIHDYRRRN
jgi:hypothetical protein